MLIPIAQFLARFAVIIFLISWNAQAEARPLDQIVNNFTGFKDIIFWNDTLKIQPLNPVRPHHTNVENIEIQSPLKHIIEDKKIIGGCIETKPYSTSPLMQKIGLSARALGNESAKNIEAFEFQPYFSGLKGPKITMMRRDFERAVINHQGSAQEIYHNTDITDSNIKPCGIGFHLQNDIELNHHIDLTDSDESPLIRSDIIVNNRAHFGGYFMGTSSTRFLIYDNLQKEVGLRQLDRIDPIRQDVLGFAWQGVNLDRLMLSGFATPMPDFHVAVHAGYLEEMFFGFGGEFLYRPYDSALSVGAEAWATTKRAPYLGGVTTLDRDNKQYSALLNLWYDVPQKPFVLGFSAGRFLDGDDGVQARARYTPANSWTAEGFLTFSNEDDSTLDNNERTYIFAGLRLSMPLGNFPFVDDNSRQTISVMPFARDKGQKIDNPYPLYDLTDPWQAKNLYRYWDRVVAQEQ